MRQYVSRARRIALAVPAVLTGLALTTGVASATTASAHPARPVAANVTWTKIKPINNWHSAESPYATGDPAWAIRNGMVYLAGSVKRSGGTATQFGVLPAQARPSHDMWITVYTLNDTTGTLYINTSGQMDAYGASSPGFLSLAAVSFPARTTRQTKFSLRNGWHSEQSAWNSGDPSYSVSGGVVRLAGSLATPGTNDEFAVLPKAARPSHVLYLTVYTFGGTFGTVQIDPNGVARAYSGSAASFTSLAGVSYPVASAKPHKLTLLHGWHSEQGAWNSGNPSYAVSNGIVYLSGSLATSGTNEVFGVLPKGYRPSHLLYIKVYTYGSTVGTVFIDPNGTMEAYGPSGTSARQFTSLAGLSFPLGS
ncbi:MAG TPA: hypothetical protein VF843_00425 [Streptosporangiaceae bacterium]